MDAPFRRRLPLRGYMPDLPENRSSFDALYRATVAPLRRYLARILGDSSEAQDVAHDAYLRIYPVAMRAEAQKPEALLYTTARRLAFNRLKRRRISPIAGQTADVDFAPAQAPDAAQQTAARQELQRLEEAIAALPPGCRAVLLLRKVELLSHRQIAERLGIAVSTVEKQHARALRLLRAALAEDEPAGPTAGPTANTDRTRP